MSRFHLCVAALLCGFVLAAPVMAQAPAHAQPAGGGFGQGQGGFGQAPAQAGGQDQASSTDSYKFQQGLPVNIRKSNNAVVQIMLVGIGLDSITVMSPQGKTIDYPNNTVRSVRSLDGSFFYNPSKDSPAEMIAKLNKMQPQQGGTNPGIGGAAGRPGANGNSTVPFTVTGGAGVGAGTRPGTNGAHMAGSANFGQGNSNPGSMAAAANSAQAAHAAHAQGSANSTMPMPFTPSGAHTAHAPPSSTMPMPNMGHNPSGHNQSGNPSMPMPNMGHSSPHGSMPSSMPMPNTSPNASHNPGMGPGSMGGMPGQNMMVYECQNCKHRITSSVEIKAGHKCEKCGVVWGQVKDEHGRVTSSSPAAKAGGAVGLIVVVIGIIAAIVRKSQSA